MMLPGDPILTALTDIAFEPLLLLDGQHRVVAANRAARDLFPDVDPVGQPVETLLGSLEFMDMLACANDDPACPEIQFAVNQQTFRARCICVSGQEHPYIAVALQDITQLLRLNRARRDMVANISHELRTPISAIRLLRDTLSRQEHVSKKQRQKILRKIGTQLDTLQHIVDGMHDLSMIESGQAIMRLVETPLLSLVREALESLDEQIERREIRVKMEIPTPLYVLVDPAQIGRVLVNLIHNALKVTPKQGTIRLEATLTPDGETALVSVSDSGPGIPPEERERVFERFYQLDEARSSGRGSGLGLSIAKHIIEAHNGRVWVEESDLGGARLCFTLMADAPPATFRASAKATTAES